MAPTWAPAWPAWQSVALAIAGVDVLLAGVVWLRLGKHAETRKERADRKAADRALAAVTAGGAASRSRPRYTSEPQLPETLDTVGARIRQERRLSSRRLSVADKLSPMVVNPFVNDTPKLTRYERLKLSVMSVTILPIRSLMVLGLLLGASGCATLLLLGAPRAKRGQPALPLEPWRRKLMASTIKVFGRGILFACGFYYIKTTGRLAPAEEAPVFVPNHLSFIDPIWAVAVCGCSAVSRASNFKLPIVGSIMRAIQCIGVDRNDPDSRSATTNEIKRRAAPGSGFPRVVLFPEGTTTNGRAVISFKAGAFGPGRPVQPCAIRLPFKHFDPTWVEAGPGGLVLALRVLCQFVNHMEVQFLPVYTPSPEEVADARLFARNVQKTIARTLDVPVTEHSYADVQLAMRAARQGQSPEAAVVEFNKLRKVLDIDQKSAQEYLDKFAQAAKAEGRTNGTITFKGFCKVFGHGETEEMHNLYDLLDLDGDGALEPRDFLVGLALINEQGKEGRVGALRVAFKMLAPDGRITAPQLGIILKRAMPDITAGEISKLFAEADSNGDGHITVDEFIRFAESYEHMLPVFRQAYF